MKRLESIQTGITMGRGGYSNANPYTALAMTNGSDTESTGGDTVDTIVAAAMAGTEAKMDSIIASQQQLFTQFANMTMNQPYVPPTMPTTIMPPAYMAPAFNLPPTQSFTTRQAQYNAPPPTQYIPPGQAQYNVPIVYPPQAQWQAPPVNQVNVPMQYSQYGGKGGYNYGGSRCGRGHGGSRYGRGRGRTTYVDSGATISVLTNKTRYGPQGMPMTHTNPVKKYNNWDMCYTCGFDVESGHTSMTCPQKKEGHQTGCNRGITYSIRQWGIILV
jgi:hypothetical protein